MIVIQTPNAKCCALTPYENMTLNFRNERERDDDDDDDEKRNENKQNNYD